MNLVTVGYAYTESLENDWTYAASMFGRFTDFQVLGRVLQDEEMEDITGCRKIMQGDILSWEKDNWFLNGTDKTNVIEYSSFDKDVCKDFSSSYH